VEEEKYEDRLVDAIKSHSEGTELEELRKAAKEVIWAANRDPGEGPTGWAQALSKLARLAFDMDEVVPVAPDAGSLLTLLPACPHCMVLLLEKEFELPTLQAEVAPDIPGYIICPGCGMKVQLEEILHV
jgi:hypothetical protein